MLPVLIVGLVSQAYTYLKSYKVVHFKYMQLITCQLYLN